MELFEEIHSGCEADIDRPLHAYLCAKKAGRITPPYIPQCSLRPIHQLCRLAVLWHEAGFTQEAGELANWLLPFESFLPLWCPEKEYREKEGKYWFSRLANIKPILGSPLDVDIAWITGSALSGVFTLSGDGTSVGMVRAGKVEIRAVGPQTPSLQFGIQGRGIDGWTRCFALPEVWLELKPQCVENRCHLDLRWVGLSLETPLSFAFYVKADLCQIGHESFKPKSLRRFHGEGKRVQCDSVIIESTQTHKIQVIPLAGEGCFWDCDFLISFEIHPLEPQTHFILTP